MMAQAEAVAKADLASRVVPFNRPLFTEGEATHGVRIRVNSKECIYVIYIHTDGLYTKGTRAHTHREPIQEWLWEPKGSSLEYI